MNPSIVSGVFFALLAALAWGLVFIAPVMLPEWPPLLIAVCRYLAFGVVCMPMLMFGWRDIRILSVRDWWSAVKLSLVGNFVYYGALAAAIQRADAAIVSAIIGTIPVFVALISNRSGASGAPSVPWTKLAVSTALIALGLILMNFSEIDRANPDRAGDYLTGIGLAVVALACWVWYPIKNAEWLQRNKNKSPASWATAQGLVTLPMAVTALFAISIFDPEITSGRYPDVHLFVGLMLAMGLVSSWAATVFWNKASQILPTAFAGQLIVLETIVAQVYGYSWRGDLPDFPAIFGMALLVTGVLFALRIFSRS